MINNTVENLSRVNDIAIRVTLMFNLGIQKIFTLTRSAYSFFDLLDTSFNILTNPLNRAHQGHPPQVFGHFVETPDREHLFTVFIMLTQLHVLSLVPTVNLPRVSLHPQ